jgi:hypothetical protein
MSDLFHEQVPDEYIVKVARVMVAANWHTYQILTKRAERMQRLLKGKLRFATEQSHIWWGVSVENRKHGLPRIDLLRNSPAQVRFLSIEPLLEHLGPIRLQGINWVIVGGESGPGARPMDGEWVRDIRAQCQNAKIAFFFKQWGGVRKAQAGRELDKHTYDELPERRQNPVPDLEFRRVALERLESKLVSPRDGEQFSVEFIFHRPYQFTKTFQRNISQKNFAIEKRGWLNLGLSFQPFVIKNAACPQIREVNKFAD